MAHPTLEYIRGLRKNLETKKAEITGDNPPSSMPGSEHDKPIPSGAKEPDKETKDQTMVPNSGLGTSGAGDDSKITHTNDLTAGEAALTPAKKPEVTGDAEAQVPGGKTAEAQSIAEKTAEQLGAEILEGVTQWEKKQAEAAHADQTQGGEQKKAADTQGPSSGAGTGEALITDKGKEPDQTKDVQPPTKKEEVTPDAMAPATGEGASGETAAAAKEAADAKKQAGALDMELTSDVLAKIAAVMLATEEGTKLAEATLAKAAGAEAAEKTLNFLRTQNDLAQKQAEYQAGQRDALLAILKQAQDAGAEAPAAGGDAGAQGGAEDGVAEIADTLDQMVEAGEITEDQADQVVVELAQALQGGAAAPAADAPAAAAPADGGDNGGASKSDEGNGEQKKEAQDAGAAAAGDAAINDAVAVPPDQLGTAGLPQEGMDDITPEEVNAAIDQLVSSGDITDEEADQLVAEITGAGAAGGDAGAAGDEESISPEEIATALQEAVQSGELKPEDVQQVLADLENVPAPDAGEAAAGGDAGEAAAGGDAGAAAAAPAAAPAAPADEPKTAGAKLLAAINAAREQKKAAAQQAAAK